MSVDAEEASSAKCKKIGDDFTTISTRDHHCESHCTGEPTRTNYVIELPVVEPPFRYSNPKLTCGSGPCAFSKEIATSVTWSGRKAKASFDVWSHPMTWRLAADVEECRN